jgi:hypothetical protein
MERQDVVFLAIALCIVIIIALVVKPVLSGESIGELPFLPNSSRQAPPTQTVIPTPLPPTSIPPTAPTAPTPTPPWDGTVHQVGFVDPSTYHIDLSEYTPGTGVQPSTPPPSRQMVTYAVIQGRWSGTTEIITIPFPYWEMHYTVTELTEPGYVFPSINIQVMDADDPNRFVRIVNPGILDPRNWKENDPRPWVERFFEGGRNYYFVITTRFVRSYSLEIKVPKQYMES